MKSALLDTLLEDDSIKSLLHKSEDLYWENPLDPNQEYCQDEMDFLCRIGFMLSNASLVSDISDLDYTENAYKLLKSFPIKLKYAENVFENTIGYDFKDKQIIYYFLLASLALKMDKTISARLNLKGFDEHFQEEETDWGKRTLYSVLKSLLLLIRKHNGFSDIREAITLIEALRNEQCEFEQNYISNMDIALQQTAALSLVGIYHVSKAVTDTAEYLINGYSTQQRRITSTIRQHIDVAIDLQNKDSRLVDFFKIIWNDLQLLIKNSIWSNTGFHDKIKQLCSQKAQNGLLELLPSQQKALADNMLNVAANAIVLQMPTSAGKTLMAEFNILITRSLRSDSKIVYIVPSRALMNQVYFDLKEDLQGLGINVERTSAAVEVDPTEDEFLISDDIDIMVTTPEKLDLLIRRQHSSVEDVSLFIVDEAHTIENGERGARLELLLTMLRRERPDAKYMLLSPFLPERGDKIKDWLGGGNAIQVDWKPSEKLVFGVHVTKRKIKYTILPTPFTPQIKEEKKFETKNSINLATPSSKKGILEYATKRFGEKGKTLLILCKGKKTANSQARTIAEWVEAEVNIDSDVTLVQKFMEEEIGCPTTYTELPGKGIAVHHAGLSEESKILIEYLIRKGKIQYVCATTTIAEGVNFPVSSVYFDTYTKGRKNTLSANDFWNIAGRAGRTMVDDIGKIILPFNDTNNITTAKGIISKSAEELTSVLAQLFVQRQDVTQKLYEDNGINQLIYTYPDSFGPLFQYFVHLLNITDSEYVADVEDLFKDTLAYTLLNDSDKETFITLCKQIYLSIQAKYISKGGALKFADKTGFSVPSVLNIMHEKSTNREISDLDSWEPDALFDRNDPNNLAQKIKVIAALKETQLGTDSIQAPFNPEIAAKLVINWVKGEKLNTISAIHPNYRKLEDITIRVSEFVSYMNSMRFKASWGLSALEGIVRGNEDEMKDSYVPSFVYYGVDNKKALAMRMLGIPRALSGCLSQIIEGDMSNYSFSQLRNNIKSMSNQTWDSMVPSSSRLSGKEWKRIVDILLK